MSADCPLPIPAQLFASSAFACTILSHAGQNGLCVEDLLRAAGIDAHWLSDQRQQIPAQLVERLWRECELAGADRYFGCELINGMATSCLQGLNILLDSAATLRASLECFCRYLPLVSNYLLVELQELDGEAQLHLRPAHAGPHFFALDAATLSLVRNIARRVGQSPATLFSRVSLTGAQAAGEQLQRWGIAAERGEHPSLGLALSALDMPLLGANSFLHQQLLRQWQACGLGERHADGLQLAQHWLKAGDQPIERIAERLGYRQPSNFIRAFRKQFGITPKQFRLVSR